MARPSTSPKKRKASDRATSSPNKSSPSPKKSRTTSIRVEVSPNNPDYDPVVVSFPRGVPSSVLNDNSTNQSDPPRFTCTKLKASSSRGRRISGEDDNCTYTASATGRGHDGRLTKTYVCVYDKKKKTLKLVPSAEKGTVFALEQAVKSYTPNVAHGSMLVGGQTQGGDAAKVISASDRVQMLVESFGSKKKQKVMASKAANKVNVHSVVGAGDVMMQSVVKQEGISIENKKGMEEGSKMVNPNDVAYEQARKMMLPPYDIDADTPYKVYNAQAIAGTLAWDKTSRIVDKVLAKLSDGIESDWVTALLGKKGFRPSSLIDLLKSIDPTKKGSLFRIKVGFFLALALKFYSKIQRKGVVEGASLDDCISQLFIPHEVGARLFELFASPMNGNEEGGYVASRQQKNKMQCYILILYMIASGKTMKVSSIDQLCRDMKLDMREASLLLREAGFTVKKTGAGDMGVSLSVPLKFPPPKRGKKT
mmetsp:Transcript_27643/g.47085  ORF Transcript_27643/g.47085 Transcript_27643/m.47085 type:complete len:479 (-) Transcript_27643:411-1847(-)